MSGRVRAMALWFGALSSVIVFINASSTKTMSASKCASVNVVFARGSGETVNADTNQRWKEQFQEALKGINYTQYELGSEIIDGHRYPAVDISDFRNLNAIGAFTSSGRGNDYGKSVDEGVAELVAYMKQTDTACQDTRYILGGYSQGAQVMGQALAKLDSDQQSRVAFVALFGDPKLYLPEGVGSWPPACRGEEFSAWRRVIDDCNTDKGILGARKPYAPSDMAQKVGLWCYAHDAICGGSPYIWETKGHGTYRNKGNAIDEAAVEAAEKLKAALHIPSSPTPGADVHGLDLAVVFDTTGSMSKQIESLKRIALTICQKITRNSSGRVALVEYRDINDDFTAEVRQRLTSDPVAFTTAIEKLTAGGGGDQPEAALHALMTTFNSLEWKAGAEKAALIITDAPYHDPDRVDGTTTLDVVKRSLEIDPVNVYAVVPDEGIAEYYKDLSQATAGQVIYDGDPTQAIMEAVTKVLNRPTVVLAQSHYSGAPGETFTFDASKSYVDGATIAGYDWDFDGDGAFDQTTTTGKVHHVYDNNFEGVMHVRVRASNDTIASQTATIAVERAADLATSPAPVADVKIERLSETTARLSWTSPAGSTATQWVVTVNDAMIGVASADRLTTVLTDLDPSRETVAGIIAVDEAGRYSDIKTVALAAVIKPTTKQSNAAEKDVAVRTQPNAPAMNPSSVAQSPSGDLLPDEAKSDAPTDTTDKASRASPTKPFVSTHVPVRRQDGGLNKWLIAGRVLGIGIVVVGSYAIYRSRR